MQIELPSKSAICGALRVKLSFFDIVKLEKLDDWPEKELRKNMNLNENEED